MKFLFLSILLCCSCTVAESHLDADSAPIAQLTMDDLRGMSDEQQHALSERLQPYLGRYDAGVPWKAKGLLVELGDTNAISELTAAITNDVLRARVQGRAQAQLIQCEQPLIVPRVANLLYSEESVYGRVVGGEVRLAANSVVAAQAILSVLSKNPAFSEDTREWARTMYTVRPHKTREVLRLWWELNSRHFEAKDYAAVSPLTSNEYSLTQSDFRVVPSPPVRIDDQDTDHP